MESWVAIVISAIAGLSGAAVGYGLTLGRLRTVERDVERLERTTATKEAHGGLADAMASFRAEMDRRLDQMVVTIMARLDRLEGLMISRKDGE